MKNWWDSVSESEKVSLIHWLLAKQLLDIPSVDLDSVRSMELERRMSEVDWEYAFYDPLHDFIEAEGAQEMATANQVEQIVLDIHHLELSGKYGVIASQLLQVKYWFDTDMEIQISCLQPETLEYTARELSLQFVKKLYHRLKTNTMKEEVLDYLSNEIKFGGFDEKLIPYLKEHLEKNEDKFRLTQETQIGKDTVYATLILVDQKRTDSTISTISI